MGTAEGIIDLLSDYPGLDSWTMAETYKNKILIWFHPEDLYLLPNGWALKSTNHAETAKRYHAYFDDNDLFGHGLTLNDGDFVFDYACDDGLFCLWAHHHCRQLHYLAMDPNEIRSDVFKTNMALFDLDLKLQNRSLKEHLDAGLERIDLFVAERQETAFHQLQALAEEDWHRLKQIAIPSWQPGEQTGELKAMLEGHGFHLELSERGFYARHRSRARAGLEAKERFLKRAFLSPVKRDAVTIKNWLYDRLGRETQIDVSVIAQWPRNELGEIDKSALPLPEEVSDSPLTGSWARELGVDVICLKPYTA